jgi:hypothetical protein
MPFAVAQKQTVSNRVLTMKTFFLSSALFLLLLFSAPVMRAATVNATGSGNWDSTTPDAPWPLGVVPAATDNAVVGSGFTVTVVSPATINNLTVNGTGVCQNNSSLSVSGSVSGNGALTQGSDATLTIAGGSSGLTTLNATASGNTVNYTGNAGGGVKITDYYHLIFSGNGTFFNNAAMALGGNFTLSGTAKVQEGASINIAGDLNIGSGTQYDPSCFPMSVAGNTFVSGTLTDLCGGGGLTDTLGNVTVLSGGKWLLTDVTQWSVSGNVTNEGTMSGSSGGITCVGTGTLVGSAGIAIPRLTITGTYALGTTVTVANTPTLGGTLIMDIGQSYKLIRTGGVITYGGVLTVVNSGAAPSNGSAYQLFSASSYNGSFSATNLPSLSGGLVWVDTLLTNGTITASSGGGGGGGSPTLTNSISGGTMTLSWDSTAFPGCVLQAQTNSSGISSSGWSNVAGGSSSPVVISLDPANPAVFFRLFKP